MGDPQQRKAVCRTECPYPTAKVRFQIADVCLGVEDIPCTVQQNKELSPKMLKLDARFQEGEIKQEASF